MDEARVDPQIALNDEGNRFVRPALPRDVAVPLAERAGRVRDGRERDGRSAAVSPFRDGRDIARNCHGVVEVLVLVYLERADVGIDDERARHRRVFGGKVGIRRNAAVKSHLVHATTPRAVALFVGIGLGRVPERKGFVIVRDGSDIVIALLRSVKPQGCGFIRKDDAEMPPDRVCEMRRNRRRRLGRRGAVCLQLPDCRGVRTDTDAEAGRRAVVQGTVRSRVLALAEDFVEAKGFVAVARFGGVIEPGGEREGARQVQVSAIVDKHAAFLDAACQVRGIRIDLDRLAEPSGLAGPGERRHLGGKSRISCRVGIFAKGIQPVHVPDADVVRPHLRRAGGHVRFGFAVSHREPPPILEDRHLDPEERLSAGIPRIDLVGKDRAILVHDLEVCAVARRRIVDKPR